MTRLAAQALVEAVPRDWFEEYVRALFDRAEALTLDEDGWIRGDDDLGDVTLVEGDHLTVGARYQRHTDPAEDETGDGTTEELVITSWDRTGEVAAEITTWHPGDDRTTWTVRLAEPDALRSIVAGGEHHGAKRMHRLTWAARFDCRQWWRQADGKPAPLTVQVRHAYALGHLEVRPAGLDGGKWRVSVTARLRGRGWARPFAAVGLLFLRGRLETHFRQTVAAIARDWNEDIPPLLALDPHEAEFWTPGLGGDPEEARG